MEERLVICYWGRSLRSRLCIVAETSCFNLSGKATRLEVPMLLKWDEMKRGMTLWKRDEHAGLPGKDSTANNWVPRGNDTSEDGRIASGWTTG